MASEQSDHLAEVLGAAQDRLRNPDLGLPTVRDICEALGALAKEPEGVTYAEVDAGGVPALWCIPRGCDTDSVLLHCHAGGTVVFSMNSDRKAAGHLAKAAGIRASCWTTGGHRRTNSRPNRTTWRRPIAGCSSRVTAPRKSPAAATRLAATSP